MEYIHSFVDYLAMKYILQNHIWIWLRICKIIFVRMLHPNKKPYGIVAILFMEVDIQAWDD